MNYGVLLKRAFDLTKRYRVLWLFGILVALTGGTSGLGNGSGYRFNQGDLRYGTWPDWLPARQWSREWGQWLDQFDPGRYVGLFVACCCLLLIFAIAALILQYVGRTALMRSVDRIEATGSAPTWREGFRLGWSNRAFRLWLLELIVGIVVVLAALLLMTLAASPLLLLLTQSDAARAIGIIVTVLLGLPVIAVLIAAAIVLSVLGQFWSREIALGNRSVGEAVSRAWALVRGRLRDVGLLWLLMAGIEIGYTILLLPVVLVVLVVAGLLGAGAGFAVYSLADSVAWAIGVGLPIFIVILAIPLTFVGGLFETFKSSTWTLAYREVAQPVEA